MRANEMERRAARGMSKIGWIAVAIAIPLIGWRLYNLPPQAPVQTASVQVSAR